MAKKRLNAKEKREAQKKKILSKIIKNDKKVKEKISVPELTEEELKEKSTVLEKKPEINSKMIFNDMTFVSNEKNKFQKQLEAFENPLIYDTPEFLTDKTKSKERKEVFKKFDSLFKYRFSLVMIADILETNDYSRLDEIVERKENIRKLLEKYAVSESSLQKLKLFSKFKSFVGDEYSKVYFEQEEKVKATIKHLSDGAYLKKGKDVDEEKTIKEIEDIISNLIDSKDFNLACQIETQFVNHELNRATEILSSLHSRKELNELVNELVDISKKLEERSHAYNVMDMLISGKKEPRKIINDGKGER